MASISCTLLKMLMMPKLISSARVVVAMMREFSATHNRMLLSTLRVKRGTSVGIERTNAIVTAPLTMPTTKAATIASL